VARRVGDEITGMIGSGGAAKFVSGILAWQTRLEMEGKGGGHESDNRVLSVN
jgi:hypothetical protein